MNTLKQTYIDRAQHHQDADEIVQRLYWEKGKGCCVGCLAHANENAHCELEKQTNIPEWLSRVADTIHEGLTKEESKKWPLRFISSVPEQVFTKEWTEIEIDKKIKAPFLIMVLESLVDNFDHNKFPDVKVAIEGSIALWKRGDIGSDEWKSAAAYSAASASRAADSAARAADSASRAAYSAARAANTAAYSAYSAADRAAYSASRAAYSASRAADSAAYSAYSAAYSAADRAAYSASRAAYSASRAADSAAYSAYSAADSAARAAYKKFSDALVEIMMKATQTDQKEGNTND